ncbi:MAG: hydroxymethylpyrimidine pyrophosphatase-like HAD family hydrolase [Flavobacteriaceae bacterium]|jgi:hydroxymethylpyrimidine pyrophosphatase-like HAD family hydrolase|uniref:BT0820 family HAD-type phosphatase n=1 Tax=Candidatus Marifrigoribacter sp. Uisw_064 TaxID=3230970 RepID=UPI003AECD1ED
MIYETLTIAVDFDGTIVDDAYPKVGKEKLFAFETLKKLQEKGHRLILWTYRSGRMLEEAIQFCKANGITFYSVNSSFPEEIFDEKYSRKINADVFIDDRNIGEVLGWGEVYQTLLKEEAPLQKKKKKNWFGF